MATVNLKALIGKLNSTCTRTLEGAAGLCLSRSNYNVEVEHWFLKLLEGSQTDIQAILKAFNVDVSRLTADLTKSIDRLKTGNSSQPLLSQHIVDMVREAWVHRFWCQCSALGVPPAGSDKRSITRADRPPNLARIQQDLR